MSVLGPRQVLELAKVSRTFGRGATAVAALRDVDLTVSAGEFVAVMGPSGSGKSSLLALAGGLDRLTSGGVLVESTTSPAGFPACRSDRTAGETRSPPLLHRSALRRAAPGRCRLDSWRPLVGCAGEDCHII